MNAKPKEKTQSSASRWVGYRKEIKVLDCTIRDGGLMNDSNFEDKTVRAVYEACVASGVDFMEIGYKNSKKIYSPDKFGAWRFCGEDDIKYLMWEYREDISLDVDESAGLAPINGGFIDGWVLVTSPAHNATSRIFRLRYEEIVSYLRKHDEGYF